MTPASDSAMFGVGVQKVNTAHITPYRRGKLTTAEVSHVRRVIYLSSPAARRMPRMVVMR